LVSYNLRLVLTAVQRRFGEYWSNLDTRSTASGGMRLPKSYTKIKLRWAGQLTTAEMKNTIEIRDP